MSALAPTASDKRLSEQEQKLVITLLSDPTYFPIEFKTWLKRYIEDSDIRINANQVYGGSGTGAGQPVGLPAGIVLGCPGNKYPADCMPCDGRVLSRVDYAKLFDAIATTWGAGDGSTNFNIPDFRDRALYGAGSRVGLGLTDGLALGSRGGPNHYHSFSGQVDVQGSHGHNVSVNVSGGCSGGTGDAGSHAHTYRRHSEAVIVTKQGTAGPDTQPGASGGFDASTTSDGNHNHSFSGSFSGSGSGSADSQGAHQHNYSGSTSGGYGLNLPSFAGILWVITTGK